MKKPTPSILLALVLTPLTGCESEDPATSPPGAIGGEDSGSMRTCDPDAVTPLPAATGCTIPPTDYTPRDPASAGRRYPRCISDDNSYHPYQADVPSNARVAAIESIGAMLGWKGTKVPTPSDFEQARLLYTQPEGVDSRVQRREDIHYPEAPKPCRDMTAEEIAQYRDRCVGPGKIIPLLNDAFDKGQKGIEPLVQAARIEAALVWFMWTSYYKEGLGCSTEFNQCDSTSSYWAGHQDRMAPPTGGLGRYVKPLSPEAYERGWDAVLAMRCWRDLDNPNGVAMDMALMNRVGAQLDRVADHALALIVRHRLRNLGCNGAWETVKVWGAVLDRAATLADAAKAKTLHAELAKTEPMSVDVQAAISVLDAVFPCP